jgi:drug/metabolite transporter (DMT)-like permease
MHIAIILAFLMTIITASSNILLKKGFVKLNPFLVSYFSVILSTLFLWLITLLNADPRSFANYKGIAVFAVIGTFAPPLVRTFTYYGIHTLGAGRSAPLRALTPFFATLIAIWLLHESPHPLIFSGIALIIAGTVLITREPDNSSRYRPAHLAYPLFAALLAGIAANLRKYGLITMPNPVFASAVAATSASLCMTIYVILRIRKYRGEMNKFILHRRELGYITTAGVLTSIGEITDLSALLYGKVSLVVPIFATTPFMIILLSDIFLKKHERITKTVVISACLIITGVYITISRASP